MGPGRSRRQPAVAVQPHIQGTAYKDWIFKLLRNAMKLNEQQKCPILYVCVYINLSFED